MVEQQQNSSSSLRRGTAIVGSLTLLSRLLGFIREVLIAKLFGASSFADTFFVAFRIPNLLRSIFAEGALTSAFVPVFTEQLKAGEPEARKAFCSVATLLLSVTVILTILGIHYADQIVRLIAPGFTTTPERFALCVELTQIMLPYIIFVSFIALINGALNSVKIFGVSALAQVIMNKVLIIGAFVAGYFDLHYASRILAWSVIVGGIAQVLTQLPTLKKAGFPVFFLSNPFSQSSFSVCRLILPAILGATVYQLTIFLNTQIASDLEPGAVSWLSYADRLVQLPIGVFTIALSSVLLPTLSRSLVDKDEHTFNASLIDALRYTSFIIIPLSGMMMLYADSLVRIIFERGAFTPYATLQTASVVVAYSFGLFAISGHSLMIRGIQARKDTITPALIGIATLLLTVFFSLLFIGTPYSQQIQGDIPAFSIMHLREAVFHVMAGVLPESVYAIMASFAFGAAGLALASSIAMSISMLICMILLSARHPSIQWGPFIKSAVWMIIATVVAAWGSSYVQNEFLSMLLFIVIGSSFLFLIRNREMLETYALFRRYYDRVFRKHTT